MQFDEGVCGFALRARRVREMPADDVERFAQRHALRIARVEITAMRAGSTNALEPIAPGANRVPSSLVQIATSSGRRVCAFYIVERFEHFETREHAKAAVELAARRLRVDMAAGDDGRERFGARAGRTDSRTHRSDTVQPSACARSIR
jgi:hypothetical protein